MDLRSYHPMPVEFSKHQGLPSGPGGRRQKGLSCCPKRFCKLPTGSSEDPREKKRILFLFFFLGNEIWPFGPGTSEFGPRTTARALGPSPSGLRARGRGRRWFPYHEEKNFFFYNDKPERWTQAYVVQIIKPNQSTKAENVTFLCIIITRSTDHI